MTNILGNNNGGLFGNNQNQGNMFGNNQTQNQGNMFGNNQNQGNMFGNNQTQNQGGLFGNNQNNQNQGVLFGNNQTQNQGGGLFNNQNNQNQGGLFNGGNNNNLINLSLQQSIFYTTVDPVIALDKSNSIKNIPLSKLPNDFQKAVLTMKLNLKNQEIKLDELQRYSQRIIELIDQGNKSVEKMGEFNGFINKKLNQYESIVNQINDNFKFISEAFDQEQKNINLMEQDLGFKIIFAEFI